MPLTRKITFNISTKNGEYRFFLVGGGGMVGLEIIILGELLAYGVAVKYDRYIKTLEILAFVDLVSQTIYQKCRPQRQRPATRTHVYTHTHTSVYSFRTTEECRRAVLLQTLQSLHL
jgi:hypothetical protein